MPYTLIEYHAGLAYVAVSLFGDDYCAGGELMGVVRCERGDHYVDLDWNVEGVWTKSGDFIC